MLQNCPECELPVSDKALQCPHCGYPLKETPKRKYNSKKRRLPNGFGRITKIKNQNLRKPYRAMISQGKTREGAPRGRILGYYESYNEAYKALVEYNKSPYSLDSDLTMAEFYEWWFDKHCSKFEKKSSVSNVVNQWKRCKPLYDLRVNEVRVRHIKECLAQVESPSFRIRIKSMLNIMFDYAIEYEIVDYNYARSFAIDKDTVFEAEANRRGHLTFTKEEMDILWANVDAVEYVDLILIQCYTGWRPQELCNIRIKEVNLIQGIMKGGMKTMAGIGREVPIHSRIRKFIENRYEYAKEAGSEYLFLATDSTTKKYNQPLTYEMYRNRFEKVIRTLNLNPAHKSHDPRKHFVTFAKECGMDEYAIKLIVGHRIVDVTEKVYTERSIEWLKNEIEKLY